MVENKRDIYEIPDLQTLQLQELVLFQLQFWVEETQKNQATIELTDLDSNVSKRVWRNE